MPYVIDTSCIITAWKQDYPRENFPSFWMRFQRAIDSGEIHSTFAVKQELLGYGNDIEKWARNQSNSFFAPEDQTVQENYARLVRKFPEWAAVQKGADPMIIAAAATWNATVVTEEAKALPRSPSPTNPRRIKIPDICLREGIPCCRLVGMIRKLNWVM